jgi:hypothetical protein
VYNQTEHHSSIPWGMGAILVASAPAVVTGTDRLQAARDDVRTAKDELPGNRKAISVNMYDKEAPEADGFTKGSWTITTEKLSLTLAGSTFDWDC